MMRKQQLFIAVMACSLLFPSFLHATKVEVKAEVTDGQLLSKDEVVYATLNANGELDDIYVVNTLDVLRAGMIIDYGEYSRVKNLTDLSELQQDGATVGIEAPEGKFYYQGNLEKNAELPWDITVSYLLDGQEINPSELAGKGASKWGGCGFPLCLWRR